MTWVAQFRRRGYAVGPFEIRRLSANTRRFNSVGTGLILDFSGVDCFGVEALRALFAFDDECAKAGVEWVLVISRLMSMTLRSGDRDTMLAAAGSVAEALLRFSERTRGRRLLHLGTEKAKAAGM